MRNEHKWYTLGLFRKFITNSLPVWWEFLFEHLTTKDIQGSSHWLLHCTNQSFPVGNPCFGYYDLCWLLTTSFTPLWYSKNIIFTCARETLFRYTLSFGYVIPAIMLTRDLNPLDNAHAERIKERTCILSVLTLNILVKANMINYY